MLSSYCYDVEYSYVDWSDPDNPVNNVVSQTISDWFNYGGGGGWDVGGGGGWDVGGGGGWDVGGGGGWDVGGGESPALPSPEASKVPSPCHKIYYNDDSGYYCLDENDNECECPSPPPTNVPSPNPPPSEKPCYDYGNSILGGISIGIKGYCYDDDGVRCDCHEDTSGHEDGIDVADCSRGEVPQEEWDVMGKEDRIACAKLREQALALAECLGTETKKCRNEYLESACSSLYNIELKACDNSLKKGTDGTPDGHCPLKEREAYIHECKGYMDLQALDKCMTDQIYAICAERIPR